MKALFLLTAAALALPASAQLVDVRFEADLKSMYYADCQAYSSYGGCNSWTNTQLASSDFLAGQTVEVGQRIYGHYTYNSDSPLSGISEDGAQAVHLNAVPDAGVSVGQISLPVDWLNQTNTGSFSVVNNRGTNDSFFLQSFFSQGDWFAISTLDLQDSTGNAFNDFTVPTSLNVNDFNSSLYSLAFVRRSDGDQLQISGQLRSVQFISAVPEPSSYLLASLGFAMLFCRKGLRGFKKQLHHQSPKSSAA